MTTVQYIGYMPEENWIDDVNMLLRTATPVVAYAMGALAAMAKAENLEPDAALAGRVCDMHVDRLIPQHLLDVEEETRTE